MQQLRSGSKKWDVRLDSKRYRNVNPGHVLLFHCRTTEVSLKVLATIRRPSLTELFKTIPVQHVIPGCDDVQDVIQNIFYKFRNFKKKELDDGVVAFRVHPGDVTRSEKQKERTKRRRQTKRQEEEVTLEDQVEGGGYVDLSRPDFKRSKGFVVSGFQTYRDCLQVSAVHALHDLGINVAIKYMHQHTLPTHGGDTNIETFFTFLHQQFPIQVVQHKRIHSLKGGPYLNALKNIGVFIIMIVVRHEQKGTYKTDSHAIQYTRFKNQQNKYIGRIRDSGRYTPVTMIEQTDLTKNKTYKLFHSLFVLKNVSVKIRSVHELVISK